MSQRRSVQRRVTFIAVLVVVAAGLGASLPALAATPHDSPPMTASFTAYDFGWTSSQGGMSVTIAPGGTVSFSYPTGSSKHNVDFTGAQPTSCALSGQAPASGPMPAKPSSPGWSGSCQFNTPGTYTFQCDLHTFMTATVVVSAVATNPTSTSTPAPTGTTMTMAMPTTASTPTTPATTPATTPSTTTPSTTTPTSHSTVTTPVTSGGVAAPLKIPVAARQSGTGLAVTLHVPASANGASVRLVLLDRKTTVGQLTRSKLRTGATVLSVRLNAKGLRALHAGARLKLTLQATFVTRAGRHVTSTTTVVLHRTAQHSPA